jgi:heme oxygenase (mycobilin-producing)
MVTLINVFTVSKGREEEFIKLWNETALLMKSQPGFIDTKLHRSIHPEADFAFVNVALWESEQTWQKAMGSSPDLQMWRDRIAVIAQAHPSLYNVAVKY